MNLNPIEARDLVIDEPSPFVISGAIRDLISRGWPTHAICAELPTVSESAVRRVRDTMDRAAA